MKGPLALEDARGVADPEADKVVRSFRHDHPDLPVREIVPTMARQLRQAPEAQHPAVARYFLEGPARPDWADPVLLARGQRFFRSNDLVIGASLFCASLPEAYSGAKGVDVLAITAELATNTRRRIAETGQFLIDVMSSDAVDSPSHLEPHHRGEKRGEEREEELLAAGARILVPGSRAYRSVRGVRLMHAAVRSFVRETRGPVWVREHGQPVNQQDLLGTLLTFTTVVYRGLDRLGIEYRPEDADAHLHLWCVIGSLLGIDESLLPWGRERAEALTDLLREMLQARSDAGVWMAGALLDELEECMPFGAKGVPRTVMRQLVGNETCDLLAIPRAAWWSPVLGRVRELNEKGGPWGPSAALTRAMCRLVGRSLFLEYIERGLEGHRPPFVIPDDLARSMRVQRGARARRRRAKGKGPSPEAPSGDTAVSTGAR